MIQMYGLKDAAEIIRSVKYVGLWWQSAAGDWFLSVIDRDTMLNTLQYSTNQCVNMEVKDRENGERSITVNPVYIGEVY